MLARRVLEPATVSSAARLQGEGFRYRDPRLLVIILCVSKPRQRPDVSSVQFADGLSTELEHR